ncbi:MAG: formylglycine-generating enzyme family protein [Polyangiaceae bacterium]
MKATLRHALSITAPTLALATLVLGTGCRSRREEAGPTPDVSVATAARPPATMSLTARPGMVWIPDGTLRAGTAPQVAPRVADEELPGTAMPMKGFYIDLYPFPNEPGSIPTTNVTRDEAAKACASKGKRLCTELEWERACKGPDNTTFEYGMTYRSGVCGTGMSPERASKRPNGERAACKSAFGVFDMHGGVSEWTDSAWARKHNETGLGVLRGGNARAGELVGRCSNALARVPASRDTTVGFRCCAGTRNEASVDLDIRPLPTFERLKDVTAVTAPLADVSTNLWGSRETQASEYEFLRAWFWRPVAGEELLVALGCEKHTGPWSHCGVVVARVLDGKASLLAQFATGNRLADLVHKEDAPRSLRARSVDTRGTFARDFEYMYGRIGVTEEQRP